MLGFYSVNSSQAPHILQICGFAQIKALEAATYWGGLWVGRKIIFYVAQESIPTHKLHRLTRWHLLMMCPYFSGGFTLRMAHDWNPLLVRIVQGKSFNLNICEPFRDAGGHMQFCTQEISSRVQNVADDATPAIPFQDIPLFCSVVAAKWGGGGCAFRV